MLPLPPTSSPFPYTTLFRSQCMAVARKRTSRQHVRGETRVRPRGGRELRELFEDPRPEIPQRGIPGRPGILDRKSTRLNSSHLGISYAVFCLKKKSTTQIIP